MEKSCRNCKHFKNDFCTHPDLEQSKDTIAEIIEEHVEYCFDGNIQENLQELIEERCNFLNEDEREDLIESICTSASRYLKDRSNMYLDEIGFSPELDFVCSNWE